MQEQEKIQQQNQKFRTDPFGKILKKYIPEKEVPATFVENSLLQPNEITRAIYAMSANAAKIYSYLIKCFKTEKRSHSNRNFTFSVKDVLTELKFIDGGKTRDILCKTIEELMSAKIVVETKEEIFYANLFEIAEYKVNTGITKFCFTEWFATILERKTGGNFTLINFDDILKLNSFYAIRFYQIAMSFKGFKGKFKKPNDEWFKENIKNAKNTWVYGYSIEQLKILFNLGDKYKGDNKNFLIKVIEQPFEELSKKIDSFDFKYQIVRKNDRPNGKIEGFLFWITEKKSESKKIEKTQESVAYSPFASLEAQKRDLENEVKPIFDLQAKYPEEFEKRLNEEKSKKNPFAFEIVLKKNVYDSMIADGFNI